jgi:hypothetical protein
VGGGEELSEPPMEKMLTSEDAHIRKAQETSGSDRSMTAMSHNVVAIQIN